MGNRKERRKAAKMGSGRRVKLDLFAEPDGDLGGSSAKDELEKDVDEEPSSELPKSPSSGQKPENPLSLLGQYSDDELDGISNEANTSDGDKQQAKGSVDELLEEGEISGSEDLSSRKAEKQDLEKDAIPATASPVLNPDAVLTTVVTSDDKHHELSREKPDTADFHSDTQTTGDINCSWKMVLHEESNTYYYWNTITGETSWEVPNSLVQGTSVTNGLGSLREQMEDSAAVDVKNTTAFGVKSDGLSAGHDVGYSNGPVEMNAVYLETAQGKQSVEQSQGDVNQLSSSVVGALPCETSNFGNYLLPEQYSFYVGNSTVGSYQMHGHSAVSTEQYAVDLPSHLVKCCEDLLGKLQLLDRSGIDAERHVLLAKHIVEVKVRLSDVRALFAYGSSLVPFWVHTERQLNELDSLLKAEFEDQNMGIRVVHLKATEEKDLKLEDRGEAKADANLANSPPKIYSVSQDMVTTSEKATSMSGGISPLHTVEEGVKEESDTALQCKSSINPEFLPGDDVDMDVDMEVEVPSPARNRIVDAGEIAPTEPLVQAIAPLAGEPLAPKLELAVPPPPDEEWIPPPPPDDEDIPPPPPDEPPELFCPPPPPPEPVQSLHGELYSVNFGESNMNYYGNTVPVIAGSSSYEHKDGSQIAAFNLPVHYAADSNLQQIALPNPADAAVYYGLQDGVVSQPDTVGSSGFQAAFSHLNHDPISSAQITSVGASGETCSFSKPIVEPLAPSIRTDTISGQFSSSTIVSAPATVSVKEQASVPSYSAACSATAAVASDASAAASKSKASRSKKSKVSVASSLRSNKKVSSLVDKWKAAKEELQEEEQERETPLEILEKKRKREIEEWRAQQISTGEAKENANFQPLGGDWRERVKRRRAKKEAAVETLSDAAEGIKQQPDLNSLSKDLPPGWQAYWDDSSKQLYYANAITSETTWTRPTK